MSRDDDKVIRGRFPYVNFDAACEAEVNWHALVNDLGRHRASELHAATAGDVESAFAMARTDRWASPERTATQRRSTRFREALADEAMSWNQIAAITSTERAGQLFDQTGGKLDAAAAAASSERHPAGWYADRHRTSGLHSSKLDSWHDLIDQFGLDYVAELYDVADGDIRIAAAMAGGGRYVLAINREMYVARHGHEKHVPAGSFARVLNSEKPSWAKLARVRGEQDAELLYDQYDGNAAVLPLFDGTVDYDSSGAILAVHPEYVGGATRSAEIKRITTLHIEITKSS